MQLIIEGDVTIMASAAKVWQVIGSEFAQIDMWASAIPQSTAVTMPTSNQETNLTRTITWNTLNPIHVK
jgi:hypothetical protein